MAKIAFVLLIVSLIGFLASSNAQYEASYHSDNFKDSYVSEGTTELYTVFATGIFDFLSKFVRAKVEILLYFKRILIQLLVRGIAHLRFTMIHNADFVNGIISTVAELLKVLLTNKPHFAVNTVQKIITQAEHEYLPNSYY